MLGFSIDIAFLQHIHRFLDRLRMPRVVGLLAFIISATAIFICWRLDIITLYGDAESHLNLAKRVLNSITPGLAQLGGIWLPLPHVLMFPFIWVDYFWYTGLAGAFVSGIAFVISSVYIYKLSYFVTKSKLAGFVAFIVFALNPNMLYLQSTPMTEPLLICFFVISSYYFIRFLYSSTNIIYLLLASVFAFCASVTRYDGWFLVMMQGFLIGAFYLIKRKPWEELIGKGILYGALASFGILLWFLWCYLILGNPLYFKDSEYSARTQQLEWQERGQLPAYHNPLLAFGYFFVSSMSNDGMLPFFISLVGVFYFLVYNKDWKRFLVFLLIVAQIAE